MSRLLEPTLQGAVIVYVLGVKASWRKQDSTLMIMMEDCLMRCWNTVRKTLESRQLYLECFRIPLKQWKDAQTEYYALEHQTAIEIAKQERNGFKLDVPQAQVLYAQLSDRMATIEDQMQDVFFNRLLKNVGVRRQESD